MRDREREGERKTLGLSFCEGLKLCLWYQVFFAIAC